MWIATQDGLNKYDGYKFTIYKNNPRDSLSLPNNFITALYEDHSGELWIGTGFGGLCRYDRNQDTFVRYKHEKDNPNSLCGNQIVCIFETRQHVLWIGGSGGLSKYNRKSDNFVRYFPDKKSLFQKNVNFVGAITQDQSGQLWIGTWNQGLFCFNSEEDTFFKYEPTPKYAKNFIDRFTDKLIASRLNGEDYLWFTSYPNGLYRINLESGEIRHYQHQPDNPISIGDNKTWALYQTGNWGNELWIGTESGLDRFDMQTEKFTHYQHQLGNKRSLNNDYVSAIFKDNSGLMWVGTKEGVDKFDPGSTKFKTIQQDIGNPESISGRVLAIHESILEGDRPVLWIGTSEGLYEYDSISGFFTRFKHDPGNTNSLSNDFITGIIESGSGNRKFLWISTNHGLNRIDLKNKRIECYYIPDNDPVQNMMHSICEDKDGIIWIGTQSSYLYSFDLGMEHFTRYNGHPSPIFAMHIDTSEILWLGTNDGLYKFDILTKKEIPYQYPATAGKSIIWDIFEDKKGMLWLATSDGLRKFDLSTKKFTHFSVKDGLPDNALWSIEEDKHGNLWISTNKGISKFNPEQKSFQNFNAAEGLHGDEFSRSSYKNHRGEIFFGGRNGLTCFYPDSFKNNNNSPPIVLTDFQIYNKSIESGKNSQLKEQVSEVNEIGLSYDQSVISFEFAALEYRKPEKIKYAYKMESVDPDWVFIDATRRFVTYTQLDPGEYVFKVKASNSDGIWNDRETSVKITILPPWWKTRWAYFLYAIVILGSLFGLRRYELSRQHYKHQLELEHVEAEKFQEIDRMKSHFFANISHEFRTPLTLIKGPIERWLPKMELPEMRRDFEMTSRNTNRLLQLVNQLLDLSRLESGKMKLQVRPENIVELTRRMTMTFESMARMSDIELYFTGPDAPVTVYLDREHFEKIITNLLSNALKFTPKGGKVIVDLSLRGDMAQTISTNQSRSETSDKITSPASRRVRNDSNNANFVEIKVTDTGMGIQIEHLPYIFDRFYQAGDAHKKDNSGSGIGLALTKDLVELHHGIIMVRSDVDKGAVFTIWLPLGKSHFKAEEILDVPLDSHYEIEDPMNRRLTTYPLSENALSDWGRNNVAAGKSPPKDAPSLLIVEDNPDMRTYILDTLAETYKVAVAADGQEGFEKAAVFFPDLIISDVMMPEIDGFQFCRMIKTDIRTSHIPVILLTAKSSGESKIEGLETGADDYLTKPFNAAELRARVKNLINQRRNLRERFSREIYLNPKDVTVTSMDDRFLKKASEIAEQKISDPDFSVTNFVKEMGLSRTNLYRKLNALTGLSVKEFIRNIRLKRAAHLLQNHYGTISEIAYAVGFNNPSYFTECFRKQFRQLPSQYRSEHLAQSSS